MRKIFLVTGNSDKLREWRGIVPGDIELDSLDIDLPELQSDDPEEIVADKAKRAYEIAHQPVVIEDVTAGLEKLNGLPGPFIKFFIKKLGKDVLYQLAGKEGERAVVSCSIGYYDGKQLLTVRADVHGYVVAPRIKDGFGFDITFVPDGHDKTYAEMSPEEKAGVSHRGNAIRMFVEELAKLPN